MIWDAAADVVAAQQYLRSHPGIDAARIAIMGGSYSGEEMAEAGRLVGDADAYVALSPGSFGDASIAEGSMRVGYLGCAWSRTRNTSSPRSPRPASRRAERSSG